MKKALIVFVKAPVPGTVKTRLQPHIAPDKIVKLYKTFITEIISKSVRLKGVDIFLGCTPTKNDEFLREISSAYKTKRFNQRGKNLHEKILNAFRYCLKKSYSEIILIGSDSPTIPVDFIKKAFINLKKSDLVIGPCFDQGLYLIGTKKGKTNEIFRNIELDTGRDVTTILTRMNSLNIRLSMLPFWYDVDTVDDLRFLDSHRKYLNRVKIC